MKGELKNIKTEWIYAKVTTSFTPSKSATEPCGY